MYLYGNNCTSWCSVYFADSCMFRRMTSVKYYIEVSEFFKLTNRKRYKTWRISPSNELYCSSCNELIDSLTFSFLLIGIIPQESYLGGLK